MKIKFIIVEESYIIRKGLIKLINHFSDIQILKEIDNEKQFKKYFDKLKVDFWIINTSFIDNFEQKKLHDNQKKIIVFSTDETIKINSFFIEKLNINDHKDLLIEKLKQVLNTIQKKSKKISSELTKREKDIVKYIAKGQTNKEIAEELFISIHTVITHRKNISKKLGIRTASGLTIYAILNKIISLD